MGFKGEGLGRRVEGCAIISDRSRKAALVVSARKSPDTSISRMFSCKRENKPVKVDRFDFGHAEKGGERWLLPLSSELEQLSQILALARAIFSAKSVFSHYVVLSCNREDETEKEGDCTVKRGGGGRCKHCPGFGFRILVSGFRFGFRSLIVIFRFRESGVGFEGFGFQVSRFRISGLKVPGSGFRVSVFGFRVSGFGFWGPLWSEYGPQKTVKTLLWP